MKNTESAKQNAGKVRTIMLACTLRISVLLMYAGDDETPR